MSDSAGCPVSSSPIKTIRVGCNRSRSNSGFPTTIFFFLKLNLFLILRNLFSQASCSLSLFFVAIDFMRWFLMIFARLVACWISLGVAPNCRRISSRSNLVSLFSLLKSVERSADRLSSKVSRCRRSNTL